MLQNLVPAVLKQHPGPLPCCGPPFCVEAPSGGVHFPIFFPGAENALGGLRRPGVIKATTSLHNLWLYLERQPLRLRVGVWLGLWRLPELKVSTCFLSRLGQKHLQVLQQVTQSTKRALLSTARRRAVSSQQRGCCRLIPSSRDPMFPESPLAPCCGRPRVED